METVNVVMGNYDNGLSNSYDYLSNSYGGNDLNNVNDDNRIPLHQP